MELDLQTEDLIIRYNYILGKRKTDKQKSRFIRSLLSDLSRIRDDIRVIEAQDINNKSTISRNIYVGDVKNAELIISSYYDTPAAHLGPYSFFDEKNQLEKTLLFNAIFSVLFIILGILFTIFVTIPVFNQSNVSPVSMCLVILVYFSLSWSIGHFSSGIARSKNLVRNTVAIIWMINMIKVYHGKEYAFAFLDNGVTNNHGLEALNSAVKSSAKIVYLDSIATKEKLWIKQDETITNFRCDKLIKGINYIFSAIKEKDKYFLPRRIIDLQEIEDENLNIIESFLFQ
ncbi:hypothetical protein M0R79_04325 [Ignavigranum ruoffiae]|uniref:hypothetical protein n=1 Tax=Ignavigranum ruoffiae TaxID=89093 RepID=UPI00204ED4F3|nr:hypothetical protein [Ignavigranum ruoffiae]UPQ86611.1 hypothetical protein M0R79_04325 [Ignavigranum ruoffiae]